MVPDLRPASRPTIMPGSAATASGRAPGVGPRRSGRRFRARPFPPSSQGPSSPSGRRSRNVGMTTGSATPPPPDPHGHATTVRSPFATVPSDRGARGLVVSPGGPVPDPPERAARRRFRAPRRSRRERGEPRCRSRRAAGGPQRLAARGRFCARGRRPRSAARWPGCGSTRPGSGRGTRRRRAAGRPRRRRPARVFAPGRPRRFSGDRRAEPPVRRC
jgi:hypothetical protein